MQCRKEVYYTNIILLCSILAQCTEARINNNNLPVHLGYIDKHLLILEPICTLILSGSGGGLLPWKQLNKTPY